MSLFDIIATIGVVLIAILVIYVWGYTARQNRAHRKLVEERNRKGHEAYNQFFTPPVPRGGSGAIPPGRPIRKNPNLAAPYGSAHDRVREQIRRDFDDDIPSSSIFPVPDFGTWNEPAVDHDRGFDSGGGSFGGGGASGDWGSSDSGSSDSGSSDGGSSGGD